MDRLKIFNPTSLCKIIAKSPYSLDEIAEMTEILPCCLKSYLNGTATPSLEEITLLKRFFGVDYEDIIGIPWEASQPLTDPNIRNMPWPYNLLACLNTACAITALPVDYLVSPEHEAYITEVIRTSLSQRESTCIFGFFRDGLTMQELGKREGVTRSRISDNLHKALRLLHHADTHERLIYGPEVAERQGALARRLKELDAQEKLCEKRAAVLAKRTERINEQEAAVAAREVELGLASPKSKCANSPEWSIYVTPLQDLNLSVRPYNALDRAGCSTLGDVMDIAHDGRLLHVTNLGMRSAQEVLTVIMHMVGEDLFEHNQVRRP